MFNAHRMGRSVLPALVGVLLWTASASAATPVSWSTDVFQPRAGQSITFFASSADPSATFTWNFGDGDTASGDQPTHSFSAPGTYVVKVSATGGAAYENTVTVRGNWAPENVFMQPQTTADDHPRVGSPALFYIGADDPEDFNATMSYTINWGDGNTQTLTGQTQSSVPVSHTYASPGAYAIHYKATDEDGSVTYPAETTYGVPFRVKAEANPGPRDVSFFADDATPTVGQSVLFTGFGEDLDGGNVADYAWDFGDGSTSSGAASTKSHTYASPGTYPVRLTVTDDDPGASTTYEELVYVSPAGTTTYASLYAYDMTGSYYGARPRPGQSIEFSGLVGNLPPGVVTTSFKFKWDDGTSDTTTVLDTASHTYAGVGDYRPQVDITLSNGQVLRVKYSDYFYTDDDIYYADQYVRGPLRVRTNHPPVYADAYPVGDTSCLHAGQSAPYSLYGYDDDGGHIASFDVDWNSDGTYDQLNIPAVDDTATVNHTYATAGHYLITVRAKDNDGATFENLRSAWEIDVTPGNCMPYAYSTHHPDLPQTNKAITFNGNDSYDLDGSVVTYQWDWDNDGTYDATGVTPSHTYTTDDDHEYTLKVTDNSGGVGYEHNVVTTHTGNHAPQFGFLYISQDSADTSETIFFNASGYDDDGDIVSYQWNWGDGNVSTTSSPAASHVYTTPGSYHPTVTLFDDGTPVKSVTSPGPYTIDVAAAAPSAEVFWTPEEPHPGTTISFTAFGSSPNGPINQYTWHWGDGTANTVTSGPNASHAYAAAGDYNVTVTVRDTTNVSGTGPAQTVSVKTNWAPHAFFTVTPQCATPNTTMTFDATGTTDSDSTVTAYHWDFDDGTTVDTATPTTTHSYTGEGTYTARLTASDGSATSDGWERIITVQSTNCPPQDVYFTYTPSSLPSGSPITFTGHAVDPDGSIASYTWTWGDGTADTVSPTSGGASTQHMYAAAGVYFVQVVARDNQGAAESYVERITVGVDKTPPVVTLTTPADGGFASATPAFSGAAGNDPTDSASVVVKIYSGSTATGSPVQTRTATRTGGTWTISGSPALAAGTYTAQAQQSDNAGNTGFSAPHTFTIDPTPPSITLTAPANNASTSDTTPALSGTAGIAAGDLAGVTVKIYNGSTTLGSLAQTLTTTRNGTTGAYTVDASPALPEGTYTAQATQLDAAGNPGTSTANTFTVDTTAPVLTVTAPADGTSTNDTTPQYSGAAGNLTGDSATVTVKVYAGATATGAAVQTLPATRTGATWTVTGLTPLAEGTYTVQATQLDAAGNPGTSTAKTFVVDTTPPAVTLTAPADGLRMSNTTPTYSGAAGNATGDGASVTVKIYSGSGTGGTLVQTRTATRTGGTWTIDGSPALTEGTYTAQATQTDAAGNPGTSAARTFVIDTTPATITLTAPGAGAAFTNGTIAFSGTGGTATGDGASVSVKVYAGATATGSPVQTLPATRDNATGAYSVSASPPLPDGQYTAQATQLDAAGNPGLSNTRTFTVNGPPVVTVTSPLEGAVTGDDTPAIGGARGTAVGDLQTVTLKIYAGSTATGSAVQTLTDSGSGATWSVTAAALADGTYTVQASQADDGGATGTSNTRTFRIDTTAPGVTLSAPAEGLRTSDATPLASGTAGTAPGDAGTVTVNLYTGTGTGSFFGSATATVGAGGAWSVSAPAPLADGTYTVQATQTDSAGNAGTSAAHTFVVDTTAPVVALTAPDAGAILADHTPDITGTGSTGTGDNGSVSVKLYAGTSASGSPVQTLTTALAAGAFSATPASLPDGTYTVVASQGDQAGNTGSSAARTFRIDTAAPAVTITSPATGSTTTSTGPALSGAAGNAGGDAAQVTVKLYSGTSASGTAVRTINVSRSGATWSATASPALALGTYTAQAEQADDAGHTGKSGAVTFTIVAPEPQNTAPACTDVSKDVPYGTATSVPLSCSDADGNALTLSVVAPPAHGTLGAVAGGSVTYTPAAGYSGADQFTYKAGDGKADSNVATAKLMVGAAPPEEIKKLLKLPPPGIVKAVLAGKKPASANFGTGVCPPACFIVIQLFPSGKTSGTTLGSKKFTVPEGGSVPLKVKLGTSATKKLRKAAKLKCTAVVKTTDAAGQTSTVQVNYTFKAKRKT
jgi:PKD repeat protein